MWRTTLSVLLVFGAIAWSALGIIVIFLIVPGLWEHLFGPRGAAFGAMGALVALLWGSWKVMQWADRLLGEPELRRLGGEEPVPAEAAAEVPRDWHEYTAEIVRSKRWAFYRRTRQFERLAELERETKRRAAPGPAPDSAG